jgi:formate dehydrogenase major subunit
VQIQRHPERLEERIKMENIKITIDGKECLGQPGQTILDVARNNGIDIPTLCYDDRVEIYGACGICVVEVEGNPKMVKACATLIAPDMVVNTKTERVLESRKTNLELLLSNHVGDCRPPCALNCPAGTDCQGYVGLIANGEYRAAVKLIKERIPLPGCIGRVCPHPCEDHCRRQLVDEPVSIAWLKRFAADMEGDDPYIPPVAPETGKKVAVIGGGPYGLSVAYYLRQKGHAVTIFESMPHFGGMLRYGIPQYRLPKEVVDGEVAQLEKMGIVLKPNTHVGKDISFEEIRKNFDAVALGVGAWVSTGTGCPGEDAEGVLGGIDFLRKVIKNEEIELGDVVAVVGGGNTAMDACRTAIRLGKTVYNIYRRTKDEMPADQIEIDEAEEEGVIFKNLRNPLEIIKDEKGHVKQIKLQVMELGEPDASGRRAPVPVEGKTETLDVDNVILAIGQAVDPNGFNGLDLTRKKGFAYDPETYMTSMEGVFAGGDCGNDKISIAVEAIADAVKSVDIIDAYLSGQKIRYRKPYVVVRDDIDEKTFEDRERLCRPKMGMLSPEERKDNFKEIVAGYTPSDAEYEGDRCLECGCGKYFECKLYDYANQYDVKPDRLAGEINRLEFDDDHPYVVRDPNKCILCGLCVRVCHEVMGVTALGLVKRGFDTTVQPALGNPLEQSGCINCGNCISLCPVGALLPKVDHTKPIPLETTPLRTTCTECGVGCQMDLKLNGTKVVAVEPAFGDSNKGLLCVKGKFGYRKLYAEDRLSKPLVRKDGKLVEVSWEEAIDVIASKLSALRDGNEAEAFAAFAGHMVSNEAKFMLNKLVEAVTGKEPEWQETAVLADASTDQGKGAEAICRASGAIAAEGVKVVPMKNSKVLDVLKTGRIKALYLMGENPLDEEKKAEGVEEALKQCDFIVVQDITLNETAKLAHVVLPAAAFAEANGTFTNMEGRVQRIRKAVQAPGVALADSKILGSLLARLGEKTGLQSAEDVFRALGEKVPAYKDMSYETIEKEGSMLIK